MTPGHADASPRMVRSLRVLAPFGVTGPCGKQSFASQATIWFEPRCTRHGLYSWEDYNPRQFRWRTLAA
jgi:hypothetical protein